MSTNVSANLSRDETAERSAAIDVRSIRVELDLRQAPDAAVTGFPTTTTLEFDAGVDTTWLDFIGEAVHRVTVNGADVDVQYDGARLQLAGLTASNTVTVEAIGRYSRSGEGLHRFVDPVDGETYLYTQYEPADSRRVMACFEQPDIKAPYTFVVHAPAGWRVLSNQREVETTTDAGGPGSAPGSAPSQTVEFAPTLPISSYITAIAAGPYHRVDAMWTHGDQDVPLGVLCRASLAEHLDADEIIEVTKQGLRFFSDAFEYPYPWGKYDQIFVPEYNLGAMENPGLVTFTESYVFRGASTEAQHEARATTILHEMAHMWFGDLVTMRWWDDLWLKESFADYMGSLAAAEATRFSDAWVTFANRRKAWAYAQDQLPTTHPIVADIPDLEAAKLNFDGITYAKGASVLKQLVAYVGRDAFFDGARRYFAKHAFGNTTLGDLLVELEDASGRDVRTWSRAWLETSGVSTLAIETDAAGRRVITQSDPRPHRLAVAAYDTDNAADAADADEAAHADDAPQLVCRNRVEIDVADERTPLELPDAPLTLLNDGDLTYAKVRLDDRSLETVERALDRVANTLARGLIWSALWNATRDGVLETERYLSIARNSAPLETNVGLLASVLGNAAFAVEHYVPDAARAAHRRMWLDTCWSAMFTARPGSDEQLAWARAAASAATYDDARADEIRAMLDGAGRVPDWLPLDADLRWMLLTALAATGRASEADADAELARDDTASGRTAHVEVLAARLEPDVKERAWDAAWTDTSLTNDHLDATIRGFRAGGRRDLIASYDDEYFARIRGAWSSRSIEIARRLVLGLFPASDSLDPVVAWLDANADAPAALVRLVTEQRDHLARDLRVRAGQPPH